MIAFSTVDLPAPLGPITATTSPSLTPRDTSSRAETAPVAHGYAYQIKQRHDFQSILTLKLQAC